MKVLIQRSKNDLDFFYSQINLHVIIQAILITNFSPPIFKTFYYILCFKANGRLILQNQTIKIYNVHGRRGHFWLCVTWTIWTDSHFLRLWRLYMKFG